MNGHSHMLVRQKSCQSKPGQHVGLIYCPVFAGVNANDSFMKIFPAIKDKYPVVYSFELN